MEARGWRLIHPSAIAFVRSRDRSPQGFASLGVVFVGKGLGASRS